MRVTIAEVARRARVSKATVSRVLNNKGDVDAVTAIRVREVIAATGYTPSARAVGLAKGRTQTVGMLVPGLTWPWMGDVLQGVADAVEARGYGLLLNTMNYFGVIVSSIAETLALHRMRMILDAGEASQHTDALADLPDQPDVNGAILILPPEHGDRLVALARRGFPFVVVDPRTPPPPDIAAVSAAHFAGARAVTTHLVKLGHRSIGMIAGPQDWLATDARGAGHHAALAGAGVLPARHRVRHIEPTTEHGRLAAGELLDQPERPTAIVCFNDKIAVGTLHAARERGLRVPEDLSVAGFDDIDLSRATFPTLTTVRQPLEEMGRMAVTQLARVLDGHQPEALHIELATSLVVRESTGPVPHR